MTDRPPFDAPFIWAVGIEDTNVGWPLAGSPQGLDEFALTRHYEHWREDLALAASIGATSVRYGFPWYRINPAPGQWDFRWTDEVVTEAGRLGLGLIVDLVHYGTPTWLKGSFTYMHRAARSIDDENIPIPTPPISPWPKGTATRLGVALEDCVHTWDHYGQLVEYLRMSGIIPPESRK